MNPTRTICQFSIQYLIFQKSEVIHYREKGPSIIYFDGLLMWNTKLSNNSLFGTAVLYSDGSFSYNNEEHKYEFSNTGVKNVL